MGQINRVAQILVLNEIGDDYEHFARIKRGVFQMAGRMQLSIGTQEISEAIVGVVRGGLAKAYHLSPWAAPQEVAPEVVASRMRELYGSCHAVASPAAQQDDLQLGMHEDAYEPDKLYFLASKEGIKVLAAFDWTSNNYGEN